MILKFDDYLNSFYIGIICIGYSKNRIYHVTKAPNHVINFNNVNNDGIIILKYSLSKLVSINLLISNFYDCNIDADVVEILFKKKRILFFKEY